MIQPKRKHLPHDPPPWVGSGEIFFITVCCRPRGENQLCQPTSAGHLFEAVEFRHRTQRWNMHLLLLMPDHLHALVSFAWHTNMRATLANFKEMTAKRAGIHWQRDFFDHRLRSPGAYEEKARYIRMNPVRQGLVTEPGHWPWVWVPVNGGPSGPALPAMSSNSKRTIS